MWAAGPEAHMHISDHEGLVMSGSKARCSDFGLVVGLWASVSSVQAEWSWDLGTAACRAHRIDWRATYRTESTGAAGVAWTGHVSSCGPDSPKVTGRTQMVP